MSAQVGALDVAHREVEEALALTSLVDRDHVRMLDRRAIRDSRLKRSRNIASPASSGAMALSATGRSSDSCVARYTTPIPPRPTTVSIQ
jgi:hypothetical protein